LFQPSSPELPPPRWRAACRTSCCCPRSGTTRTTRAKFHANGTYAFGNQRESLSSGQYGSVYGQGGGGGGGRWQVKGGELYMGEGDGPLEPVQTVLKRNSKGYPIIVADGVEYMQCG
jgi:hypothetical protein